VRTLSDLVKLAKALDYGQYGLSALGREDLVKAGPELDELDKGRFGRGVAAALSGVFRRRPPGTGWMPTPKTKIGSWRRRDKHGEWDYWRPEDTAPPERDAIAEQRAHVQSLIKHIEDRAKTAGYGDRRSSMLTELLDNASQVFAEDDVVAGRATQPGRDWLRREDEKIREAIRPTVERFTDALLSAGLAESAEDRMDRIDRLLGLWPVYRKAIEDQLTKTADTGGLGKAATKQREAEIEDIRHMLSEKDAAITEWRANWRASRKAFSNPSAGMEATTETLYIMAGLYDLDGYIEDPADVASSELELQPWGNAWHGNKVAQHIALFGDGGRYRPSDRELQVHPVRQTLPDGKYDPMHPMVQALARYNYAQNRIGTYSRTRWPSAYRGLTMDLRVVDQIKVGDDVTLTGCTAFSFSRSVASQYAKEAHARRTSAHAVPVLYVVERDDTFDASIAAMNNRRSKADDGDSPVYEAVSGCNRLVVTKLEQKDGALVIHVKAAWDE
jgi:hypothetical protein